MAAGDIILPDGTVIPVSAQQQIAAAVKEMIAAESKDLTQYEEVSSINDVSSLPGLKVSGSAATLVRVALNVLKGVDGKTPEITADATAIKWRYTGESSWKTLVQLSLLKGDKGDEGEKLMIRKGTDGIEWKYKNDSTWQTLVPMSDLSFTYEELTDEQKQEISKKPILSAVQTSSGSTASGQFVADGTDNNGNPKWKLLLTLPKGDKGDTGVTEVDINTLQPGQEATATLQGGKLVLGIPKGDKGEAPTLEAGQAETGEPGTDVELTITPNGQTSSGSPKYLVGITVPKGDKGEPPMLEIGTVTTLEPTQQATASIVENGETSDGKPKYKINLGLPKGNPGDGDGNVYVETTGLAAGKQYVFQPSSDGSATGQFVEMETPDKTVYITHAESQIPQEGDIVNIGQADHDKLIYAIKNNLDIVVRTQCTSFKAYGAYNFESDEEMFQVFFHFPIINPRTSASTFMEADKELNYINGYVDVPLAPNDEGTYSLVFHQESPYIIFDVDLSQATEEGVEFSSMFEYDLDVFVKSRRVAFCAKAPTASESKNGLIMFNLVFFNENLDNVDFLEYVFKSDPISTDIDGYTTTACYEIHVNNGGNGILYKVATATKETGNVTTHRHDTTYNYTDFETDVWDGTSISTSLQGSGTKDDPYLIQSCADWLHLYVNGCASYNTQSADAAPTEFYPVFKLNKNLDFGNKTIPAMDISSHQEDTIGYFFEFDGSGAIISNFKCPSSDEFIPGMSLGLFPLLYMPFIHDFVIDNVQYDVTLMDGGVGIALFTISSYNIYVLSANNVIRAKATITGNISVNTTDYVYAYLSSKQSIVMYTGLKSQFDKYKEEHGYSLGINIEATDNTVKANDGKLAIIMMVFTDPGLELFTSIPLDEISISESGATFETDFSIALNIAGEAPAHCYTNSSGSNSIILQDIESNKNSTYTATPKSLTEMQSAAFVDELNSHLPKPAFRQDPDGGTPILAGGNATITYDGYVKKSEFESFKQNINVEEPPAVIDSLSSESTTDALSANMGKKLNDEKVGSSEIRTIKKLTQSSYNGLSSKDSKTLYIIVG